MIEEVLIFLTIVTVIVVGIFLIYSYRFIKTFLKYKNYKDKNDHFCYKCDLID